ncbi:MAG: heavy metal translocating P-type ATPase [Pseudomonadota bacterium]
MTYAPAHSSAGRPSGGVPAEPPDQTRSWAPFVRGKDGGSELDLIVRGAKCGGCISKIEDALTNLPGVTTARLNLSSGKLVVRWQGGLSADVIANTVSGLGYSICAATPDAADEDRQSAERSLLIAMGVAGFSAANIMLLSVSVWGGAADMGEQTRKAFHLISGLIALPVILFSGRPFFSSAWNALRHGRTNMDVPISLALVLAYSVSVFETLRGGEHAYFDASVMLLFFLLIGRFLDARLRRRAYAAAESLAALRARTVTRLVADKFETVSANAIKPGDTVLIAPGERCAVDIVVTAGRSEVDESLVTGESAPRLVCEGAHLYAGAINLGDALHGRALSREEDSLLADIEALLEAGEQSKSSFRKIADRAVSIYVPFVQSTALLAFLGWLAMGASVRDATLVAVSTLIITCPCALALAAPVAQVVASSRLFRSGIYLKSGDALERLASVDHIVFDKTGTLTLGTPSWRATHESGAVLEQAARLARASRHPLSRAIVEAAGSGPVFERVSEHPGLGLVATDTDGTEHRLGSAEWTAAKTSASHPGLSLWYVRGDEPPVRFQFDDVMRSDAHATISDLRDLGYTLEILSGDREHAVSDLAARFGIEAWTAGASPTEKAARFQTLRKDGRRALMVGDGLNDAAALGLAHASLAPGRAMDVSQAASDAVFSGGLIGVLRTIKVARHARRTMLENFALAAGYNLIAVPIAVTGHATPLVAAIAMSASSLLVTLNALRMPGGKAD